MALRSITIISLLAYTLGFVASSTASDRPSPFSGGTEDRSEINVSDDPDTEREVDSLVPVLMGGLSAGGDHFNGMRGTSDGRPIEIDTVQAGGLWFFGGGINYTFPGRSLTFRNTFSLHYNKDSTSDGESRMVRFPIDFIFLYHKEKHRYGGGFTFHLSPEARIKTKDGTDTKTINMKDSMGAQLEYNYQIRPRYAIGARLTVIRYETEDTGETLSGSSAAVLGYFLY